MNIWSIVRIMIDIIAACLGVYCLAVGERQGCAVMIGVLMLDACRGHLKRDMRGEEDVRD